MRFLGVTRIQAVSWMLRQFKFWAKALGPSVPFRKETEWSSIRTWRNNVTQNAVGSMWTEGDRTFWAVWLWPCGWFCRRKSCCYIFVTSNRNTFGWNAVVSSTRELILLCYIVFHPVRSAHKFHFQPLKLNMKPAVAVTEAVCFMRKASVEIRQPIQTVEGTVVHGVQHISSTNTQRGSQWPSEAQGASVRSRLLRYDTSIHIYNICRFAVLSRTRSTVGLPHSWHAYAGTSSDDSYRAQRHDERYTLYFVIVPIILVP